MSAIGAIVAAHRQPKRPAERINIDSSYSNIYHRDNTKDENAFGNDSQENSVYKADSLLTPYLNKADSARKFENHNFSKDKPQISTKQINEGIAQRKRVGQRKTEQIRDRGGELNEDNTGLNRLKTNGIDSFQKSKFYGQKQVIKHHDQDNKSQKRKSKELSQSIVKSLTMKQQQSEERSPGNRKIFKLKVNKSNKIHIEIVERKKIYSKNSLYIFKRENFIRLKIIQLIEWKMFDQFILFIILLNSIALACYDYSDSDSITFRNQFLDIVGQIFTYIFAAECLLKIIGHGFVLHKRAYIRDWWNVIDFAVVITGILEDVFDMGTVKLKSLRVMRALRPLRSINAIPSMRKLVQALINSLPDFINVGIFLIFIFMLFAILGVHQYNGVLYGKCRYHKRPETEESWAYDPENQRVCSLTDGFYECPEGMYCGNPSDQGIELSQDGVYENSKINFGITNFDHIGTSLLTVFQIVSTDGWTPIMLNLMDADIPFLAAAYCIMIVIIGAYFLMNLILAVIIQAFIKIQKQELDQEIMGMADLKINQIKPTARSKELHLSKSEIKENDDIQFEQPKPQKEEDASPFRNKKLSNKERAKLFLNMQNLGSGSSDNFSGALSSLKSPMKLSIDDLKQDRKADFSFLKKINQANKIMNILKRKNSNSEKSQEIPQFQKHQQELQDKSDKNAQSSDNIQIKSQESKPQIIINQPLVLSREVDKQIPMLISNKGFELISQNQSLLIDDQKQEPKIQDQLCTGNLQANQVIQSHQGQPNLSTNWVRDSSNQEGLLQIQSSEKILEEEEQIKLPSILFSQEIEGHNYNFATPTSIQANQENNNYSNLQELRTPKTSASRSPINRSHKTLPIQDRSNINPDKMLEEQSFQFVDEEQKFLDQDEERILIQESGREEKIKVNRSNTGQKVKSLKQRLLEIEEEQGEQNQYDELKVKNQDQLVQLKFGLQRIVENQVANEEYQQNLYFQKIFDETKQNFLKQKSIDLSLRQLAHQKLGIKLKRQQNNLIREVERFKIEDRAESNLIYNFCFKLVKKKFFTKMISFFIILNTIDLSLDRYPIDYYESQVLDDINTAFSLIFLLEMIIRVLAIGLKNYFKEAFNIFDSIVVVSSMIDLIISLSMQSESGGAITALRAFRLIRVFKLAKSWKQFQNLLKTIGRTLKDISTFSILLFLFMFIYSLLGLEIFAYKAKVQKDDMTLDEINGTSPRANFDTFVFSFTTVFIILTNDGWASIYYNYYRTAGPFSSTVFFISLILVGQKVLLNLFLAILLENFDEQSLNQELKEKRKKQQKQTLWIKLKLFVANYLSKVKFCRRLFRLKKRGIKTHLKEDFFIIQNLDQSAYRDASQGSLNIQNSRKKARSKKNKGNSDNLQNLDLSINSGNRLVSSDREKSSSLLERKFGSQLSKSGEVSSSDEPQMYGKSLYLFPQTNKFRGVCFTIVKSGKFEFFIMLIIMISSVQLAIENPLNDPDSNLKEALFQIDLATTIIFSLEALAKIIAYGFVMNKKFSYLQNGWNALDFGIVIMSIFSLTPLVNDLNIFKIFRVARILRLVSRNEGLQLAVKALYLALPQVANVSIIMLLFFLIFGIIGVSYFKGKYYYCFNDFADFKMASRLSNKWDCESLGGNWQNRPWSFDDIFSAMMTLFQMATTSGWSDIMFASINTSQIDDVPIKNNNLHWILFFIVFIVVGSFFLLNLFVGVVISTFNREKDKIGGSNLLTERQKNWLDTKIVALKAKPKKLLRKPKSKWRKLFFKIQAHKYFSYIILACIILNTLVLNLKWYNQPEVMQQATDNLNYIFTAIFTLEAVIKLIGLGTAYFSDNWNIFDFAVVVGSIASIFLTLNTSFSLGGATTIIRAFRITRIFRLVKRAKNLRLVFNTFIFTLPALVNVGGLLLLLLYLYSIVGVYLFAEVKRSGILADNLNFESFLSAFITLFVISTGDAWDQIVSATLQNKAIDFDCISNPNFYDYRENGYKTIGCGDNVKSGLVFYYSYIVFVNLIFLNLFIAIILQGFEDTQIKESRLFNQETLDKFRDVWAQYDPDATTYIPISKLKDFLFDLGQPLGWDESYIEKVNQQEQFIVGLELPIYRNFSDYMFMDVLEALALRLVVQEQLNLERERKEQERERKDSVLDSSKSQRAYEDRENEGVLSEWHHTRKEEENDEGKMLELEEKIKKDIKNDINKLQFQENVSKLRAVKEVVKDSIKAATIKKKLAQDNHFTSLHQAAAHVAIQHMKYVVAKRKLIKQMNEIKEANEQDESEMIEGESSKKVLKDKKPSLKIQQHLQKNNQDQNFANGDASQQQYISPRIFQQQATMLQIKNQNQIVIIPSNPNQQTIVNINLIERNSDQDNNNKFERKSQRQMNFDVTPNGIDFDLGNNKIKLTNLPSQWSNVMDNFLQRDNQSSQPQNLHQISQSPQKIVQKIYQNVNITPYNIVKNYNNSNYNRTNFMHQQNNEANGPEIVKDNRSQFNPSPRRFANQQEISECFSELENITIKSQEIRPSQQRVDSLGVESMRIEGSDSESLKPIKGKSASSKTANNMLSSFFNQQRSQYIAGSSDERPSEKRSKQGRIIRAKQSRGIVQRKKKGQKSNAQQDLNNMNQHVSRENTRNQIKQQSNHESLEGDSKGKNLLNAKIDSEEREFQNDTGGIKVIHDYTQSQEDSQNAQKFSDNEEQKQRNIDQTIMSIYNQIQTENEGRIFLTSSNEKMNKQWNDIQIGQFQDTPARQNENSEEKNQIMQQNLISGSLGSFLNQNLWSVNNSASERSKKKQSFQTIKIIDDEEFIEEDSLQ